MGNTNFGNQNLTFKYRQPTTSESFNSLLYSVLPTGVYNGGSVSILDTTTVRITPITVLISDYIEDLILKCTTTLPVDVTVSEVAPYIIMRLEWENNPNNYVDFLSVSFESLRNTDIILGKATFTGTVLSSIDLTDKTYPNFNSYGYDLVIDSNQKLLDWASGVYDGCCKKVFIRKGIWILDSGNIDLLARGTDIIDCQEDTIIQFNDLPSDLNLAVGITYGTTYSPVFTDPTDEKRITNLNIKGKNSLDSQIVAGFFNCVNLFNCSSEITSNIGVNQFKFCKNLEKCRAINNFSIELVNKKIGFNYCSQLQKCTSIGLDYSTGFLDSNNIYFSISNSEGVVDLIGFSRCSELHSNSVLFENSNTSSIAFNLCSTIYNSIIFLNENTALRGIDYFNCSNYLDSEDNLPSTRPIRDANGNISATEAIENSHVVIKSQIVPLLSLKEWVSTYPYSLNEPTFYNGVPYKSLSNENEGNIPDESPLNWEITGGGGGSGEVQNPGIYMTNPTFDEHISGWYGFKNTDINLDYPETGVDGVCDFEISHEVTNPLIGSGSLRVYKSDFESAEGSGFSTDFTVDKGILLNDDMNVCRLQVSFFDSGYLFFKVFLFLKDTMERIEGIPIFVNTGSGAVKKYIFNIPENTTCLEYRLSFFWPFNYSNEYDTLFDEVRISRAEDIYIPSYDEKMAMEKYFEHAPSADNKFVVQSKLTEDIDNTVGIPKWRGINYLANSFVTFNGSIYKSVTYTSTTFNRNEWIKVSEVNYSGFINNNGGCESIFLNFSSYYEAGKQWPEVGVFETPTYLQIQSITGVQVLNGISSNKITKLEGNSLGEGISYTFTVEKGSVGQISSISFNYLTNSTYVDEAIMLAIRDDTGNEVQYVSNHLLKSSYGVPARHTFSFTPKNIGTHRILFHVRSIETQAWEVILDNIEIKLGSAIATYDAKLSVSVDEEYLVEDRVNNVAVSANVTISIPSSFELFGKVTVRRLHATDSGYVTIVPPAGCTIEGRSDLKLYGQYSYAVLERVSETVFALIDLLDVFNAMLTTTPSGTSEFRITRNKDWTTEYSSTLAKTATGGFVDAILPNYSGDNGIILYAHAAARAYAGQHFNTYAFTDQWASQRKLTFYFETTPLAHAVYYYAKIR